MSATSSGARVTPRDVAGTLMPGFVGLDLPEWLAARLRGGLAGVCLFAENIASPSRLRALTDQIRAANPRAVIAIDEEGGDVTRLHAETGSPFPGNAVLGRLDDAELTERIGAEVGRQLRAAGVNLDLAPDVDINSNPDNPVIGVRSFGAQPQLVARHAAAWVRGLESTGVAAGAKHFPGHGDTAQDSHLALPVVDLPAAALSRRELVPFRAAIEAGARTIMTSHILLPQLDDAQPATFSPDVLVGLLRNELGFDGVIVSDALDMRGASAEIGIPQAAVRALAGGSDLLCIGTKNTDAQLAEIEAAVLAAVSDGRLAASRLLDATARVDALAAGLEKNSAEPIPVSPPYETLVAPATVRRAFEGGPGAPWGTFEAGQISWVAIETEANIAVGRVPWGPFAAGIVPDVAMNAEQRRPDGIVALPHDRHVVLVGRDNHRHAWVRELIDAVRAVRPVTVVDMGWPSPDRRYADLATFGASRLVGQALVDQFGGGEASGGNA